MKVDALIITIMVLAVPIMGSIWPYVGEWDEAAIGKATHARTTVTGTRGPMNGSLNGLYGGMVRYDDVALLVNDNSAISREIGTYFAMRRGLPVENILNLSVPTSETINPGDFDELARQVKENLSERGLTDRIEYLVTTKGVPLRVSGNNYRMSSVDSELMLLDSSLEGSIHGNGWIDNPYFESWAPFSRSGFGVRLVTRLDGYTKEEAMRLVDLAEPSLGVRGRALLDTDPTKGYSASGYGIGNYWMVNAHDWLVENGHESLLDMNNTFRTDWTNTSAYFSWGSNDGNWNVGQISNGGFEYGTGPDASSWDEVDVGGVCERSQEKVGNDAWSMKLSRSGPGRILAYQNYTLPYTDHRFIVDARASVVSVTSPGARVYAEAFDRRGNSLSRVELYNRTGTRDWESAQKVMENRTAMATLSIVIELLGSGTVFFDNLGLRVIRPHNQWVPGAIAETCVSTGGRSMAYGTWYGQSLVADLIRDGVTGVKGYVYEPFLSSISHADILFPAYYSSYNLAEAYWMGSEFGSWMDTVLGDPKCCPYLDERPDMGFPLGQEPITTHVENGDPHLSIALFNKGKGNIPGGGKMELYMDGTRIATYDVPLGPGELKYVNISHDEDPRILGPHEFRVVLNSDFAAREMDPYNNEASTILSVNRLPELMVAADSSDIRRTEVLNISVLIKDEDGEMDEDRLDLTVRDPFGNEFAPGPLSVFDNGTMMAVNYSFVPLWNASLGFYTISALYTDGKGSFDDELLYGAFRVRNFEPVLKGVFSSTELMRGGNATLTLGWSDPDTPDGSLAVEAETRSSFGDTVRPKEVLKVTNWTSVLSFQLPPYERSRTWEFTASALDRDGAEAIWMGAVHTDNGPPSIEVLGLGKEMTRLSTATLTLTYSDPEGIPPNKLVAKLLGPEGEGVMETVLIKELSGRSGEPLELPVSGSTLLVGNYTLEVLYEDDEYEGSVFRHPGAIRIVNMGPTMGSPKVVYMEGEGEPGGTVMRGSSFSIRVPVSDPDGELWTMSVSGTLLDPQGTMVKQLPFEARPDQTLNVRVSVGSDWRIGGYSLDLTVTDPDGGTVNIQVPSIIIVDAPAPILISAKATVHLNMTCAVEIMLSPVTGSSLPVGVSCSLSDENRTEVGNAEMNGSQNGLKWTVQVKVSAIPTSARLDIRDDLGRDIGLNASLEVKVEEPPPIGDDDERPGEDDITPLIIFLSVMLVVLFIVVLIVLLIFIKRMREPTLRAPLPMTVHVASGGMDGLRPGQQELLQGAHPKGLPPAPLPPGRELNDGSLYHKPGSKETDRPRQKPGRPEDVEEVHELGPRRTQVPSNEVPMAPSPIGPEEPSEPVPFDLSQPINKGDEVVPPVEDVPDTDDNDIPGDPGQGVQEGGQGPGGGP